MASDSLPPPETVEQSLRRIRVELTAAGIQEAAGDARRLVAAALDAAATDLIRDPNRMLTTSEAARLARFVRRRIEREPVSRIFGRREFYGRSFAVTPAVLDPRPDTETLIDAALAIARSESWAGRPLTILDVGTGSGAIVLTLLAELPLATGLAIDISQQALDCAAANAAALGLTGRAKFERHDIFTGFPPGPPGGFNLVVSNPPYIITADLVTLEPEVAHYDPTRALDGGCDGLAFYRTILEAWAATPHLQSTQRALVLELGAGQSEAVVGIAKSVGAHNALTTLEAHRDLGNHIRCVAISSQSSAE